LGKTFLAGGLFGVVYLNFLLKGRFFKRWHKEKFAPRDGACPERERLRCPDISRADEVPQKVDVQIG
jgi:hypothetical protein